MKRNVSVVCLVVGTRSSGPPASQPVSCLTRLSADLCHLAEGACTIRLVFVSVGVMCEFTQDSSIWTHGIALWGCASKSNISVIQRYQSKLLRTITNAPGT